ncbi:hypothetical protein Bca52824_091939 [Brassica carinata]|uniref:Uncharacterized protein n=1 Tax=Brassica carinata TaxID=52824 RepID=A0A8X7TF57_BRACI|nr:hypothetical protein Bca52824_091939 [Brassica carinata]
MYGMAKLLINAWLNGQFQGLIGMIYEVLDREKRRALGTALQQLEQAKGTLISLKEGIPSETILDNTRQVELSFGRDGTRTCIGLYWIGAQEGAAKFKLNSEKEQCTLGVLCNGNISPGYLRHVRNLKFSVFEPEGVLCAEVS